MMSITSSTSITSINGVVLMSIITSGSREVMLEPDPTFIAIVRSSRDGRPSWLAAAAAERGLGDEGHLGDAGPLAGVDDATHALVTAAAIAADLHLGLWRQDRYLLQPVDERLGARQPQIVPVDAVLLIDRQRDVLRLGLADLVALLRELHRDRRRHDGNRDEEDDQQHQHDV